MLSRVANLTYWIARHLERAENAARILDANTQLALDLRASEALDEATLWRPVILALGDADLFTQLYGQPTEETVATFALFDRRNPSSICSSVAQARENARCARETLSSETWEQLNRLHLRLQDHTWKDYQEIGSSEFLNRIKKSIQLFYGVASSMLPRNEAWNFFQVGRFLERADSVSRLIDVKSYTLRPSAQAAGSSTDLIQWSAVLRSCSGFEAFRKLHRGSVSPDRVLEFLILEESFPRSIRYAVVQAEEALRGISRDRDHYFSNAASRSMGRLRADLDYSRIEEIVAGDLRMWLETLQERLATIHHDIDETFISYPLETAKLLG
jgi:uncharacterized alpha-E superfamily protein